MPAAPLVYKDVHHTVADDLLTHDGNCVTMHTLLGHVPVPTTVQDGRRVRG